MVTQWYILELGFHLGLFKPEQSEKEFRRGGFCDESICRGEWKPFSCPLKDRRVWATYRKKAGAAGHIWKTQRSQIWLKNNAGERISMVLESTQQGEGWRKELPATLQPHLSGALHGESYTERQGWQASGRDKASACVWEGHSLWQEKFTSLEAHI